VRLGARKRSLGLLMKKKISKYGHFIGEEAVSMFFL
jgi:hypothetical protein